MNDHSGANIHRRFVYTHDITSPAAILLTTSSSNLRICLGSAISSVSVLTNARYAWWQKARAPGNGYNLITFINLISAAGPLYQRPKLFYESVKSKLYQYKVRMYKSVQ